MAIRACIVACHRRNELRQVPWRKPRDEQHHLFDSVLDTHSPAEKDSFTDEDSYELPWCHCDGSGTNWGS
jgi:hypothetical protein